MHSRSLHTPEREPTETAPIAIAAASETALGRGQAVPATTTVDAGMAAVIGRAAALGVPLERMHPRGATSYLRILGNVGGVNPLCDDPGGARLISRSVGPRPADLSAPGPLPRKQKHDRFLTVT